MVAAAPVRPRDRFRSPVVQGGLAFVLYLVTWLTTGFRPIVTNITQMMLRPASPDPNFSVWSLRWWPYAVGHGLNPLYTHALMAPAGHSLAWVTTVPALALLASPLTVTAGPVISFNVLASLALPLSAWAAFVLCRRLTGKFWAGLAGGAVYGFSAFETYHSAFGHLNLSYSLLLPVLGYLAVIWCRGSISAPWFVVIAAVTMAVQFYLFIETFADLTAILLIALVVGFAVAGRPGRPIVARLAKFLGIAWVIAIAAALPYLVVALNTRPPRSFRPIGTDLASLVIPGVSRTFGIGWLGRAAAGPQPLSAASYVGVPILVLVVLLAVTGWRSGLVRAVCCLVPVFIAASLGPVLQVDGRDHGKLPWARLYDLPLVRNSIPVRLMEFAYLALAVAVALWLAGPAGQLRWARWARWPLAVLVVAVIAADSYPVTVKHHGGEVPAFISSGQYRQHLTPGEIVVVVSRVGDAGLLWQAQAGFFMRIVGGYINQGYDRGKLRHPTGIPLPLRGLEPATPQSSRIFDRFVTAHHVGAILVDTARKPAWADVFRKLGLAGQTVGGVTVYRIKGPAPVTSSTWWRSQHAVRAATGSGPSWLTTASSLQRRRPRQPARRPAAASEPGRPVPRSRPGPARSTGRPAAAAAAVRN